MNPTQLGSAKAVTRQTTPFTVLLLASLGGALEFYDFVVFVFFTSAIQSLFFSATSSDFVRLSQTFGIFAAGYLARPIGGIIMAHFGDTRGRKRVFTFSILMMALPTICMGLLPTYAQIGVAAPLLLLAFRLMQGAAIGGEAPGGWVYVAEHVSPRRTGIAISMLTSGLCSGILLGSLMAFAINTWFTKAQVLAGVWRVPFLLGGVFGLAGMWLRRRLSETPVFLEMKQASRQSRSLPLLTLLRTQGISILTSVGVTWMLTAAVVVVILLSPALLVHLGGYSLHTVQAANLGAVFALCLGVIIVGALVDRFSVRAIAPPACLLLLGSTYLLFAESAAHSSYLPLFYALAGLGAGASTLAPICMVRVFAPAIRFTGVSFSYNMAYAILGGVTPPLVLWLTRFGRLGPAHYVAIASLTGMVAALSSITPRSADPASS